MNLRNASLIAFSILTGGLNTACYHLQPAVVPMAALPYPASDSSDQRAGDLVVLLPGLGDYATAFEKQGLVAHLRGPEFAEQPVDVLAVNAHFKYYRNKTAIERLHADVIVPAREAGYERIHLIGISLGGFGALRYLRDYPGEVQSVTLIAPYVGERKYYGELASPEPAPEGQATESENPWPWIRALPQDVLARVYLGYGESDRFAEGHAALATLLDPEHVVVEPGKHRWKVWKTIWPELLEAMKSDRIASLESAELLAVRTR